MWLNSISKMYIKIMKYHFSMYIYMNCTKTTALWHIRGSSQYGTDPPKRLLFPALEIAVSHWPFLFQPISGFGQAKSNMLGQICCTFSLGKPLAVKNGPTFKE